MTAQSYILRLVLASLLAVLIVVAVNFSVDPYGLTNAPRIEGFNAQKVEINNYSRLLKKYQTANGQYDTLILGNSRVEMGIDPEHHCFDQLGWSVYNLGLPGAGVRKQLNYALHTLSQQSVKRVLLSVDFTDFVRSANAPQPELERFMQQSTGELKYLPSGEENPDYRWIAWLDYYQALFSLDALLGSVHTVLAQGPYSPDRTLAGFNPAKDFLGSVEIEGPRALFDEKMQTLETRFARPASLRDASGAPGQSYDDLLAFIEHASSNDLSIVLFTNPFHDHYWALLREHGLMPMYADWVALMSSIAAAVPGADISFWDFSQDSQYIHEVVPPAGAKTGPLQWFWEPSHYRSDLGDLMIDTMLSSTCGTTPMFGFQVF